MTSTDLDPAVEAPAARRSLGLVLAVVGIPMFMVTLDNLVVTNALPVIKTQLGASLTDLQWFINAAASDLEGVTDAEERITELS